MIDDQVIASAAEGGKLKIRDRFQLVSLEENKYQFVSLYESIRFRADDQASEILNLIIPKLQEGCELEKILKIVAPQMHILVKQLITELTNHHILELELNSTLLENTPQATHDTYEEQNRFFANFNQFGRPSFALESEERTESIFTHQQKLKESRILVIGLGRLGSRLTRGMAQTGVGQIYGSDPNELVFKDILDSAYSIEDLGKSREIALGKILLATNPFIDYTPLGRKSALELGSQDLPDKLDLLVLCEDQFDPSQFQAINSLCLDKELAWISYRNFGNRFEVGPLVIPHETACYQCLEMRRSSNNISYTDLLGTWQNIYTQEASLGSLNITTGYELLAIEIIKILTKFSRPLTYSSIFTFDLITFEAKLHPVLKVPRCKACGGPSRERPSLRIWDLNDILD